MKTLFGSTYELSDMQAAAEELVENIQPQDLCKHSLGLLFCDSELEDYAMLMLTLQDKLGFPVVGATSVATLNREDGLCEMNCSLLVLTSDECSFSVALSGPINKGNVQQEIQATYARAVPDGVPDMLFCFCPLNLDIMIDTYPEELSELSGGAPVFGGVPGFNAPYGISAVMCRGGAWQDRMVLVAMHGGIKPLFSIGVETSHLIGWNQSITHAEENVIYKVEDMTMVQYMDSVGLDAKKLMEDESGLLFVNNPILLTRPDIPAEDYMLVRTVQKLDMDEGFGVSLARCPEGHNITVGTLTRGDIETSARSAVQNLLEQIERAEREDPAYKYSTVVAVSCAGRYMAMTPILDTESTVLQDSIPGHLQFAGFYSYGELAPTSVTDGVAINTAQNESLVLCAL